jgi:hypothetical protein
VAFAQAKERLPDTGARTPARLPQPFVQLRVQKNREQTLLRRRRRSRVVEHRF